MRSEALRFGGIRFESARAVGQFGAAEDFFLATDGRGRQWSTPIVQGFWRSFGSINLANADEVLGFIARRGDPFGTLSPDRRSSTGHWAWLRDSLSAAAAAWDPPEWADGLSCLSTNPARLQSARLTLRSAYDRLQHDDAGFEFVAEPGSVTPRARPKTLAAFMVYSASSALDRGVPMRVCGACGEWFEARRIDVRTCSGSCRAAISAKTKRGA